MSPDGSKLQRTPARPRSAARMETVYWNIRWGLYNSSAAPAEALGCMEPLSEWQGRQRFTSKEIE